LGEHRSDQSADSALESLNTLLKVSGAHRSLLGLSYSRLKLLCVVGKGTQLFLNGVPPIRVALGRMSGIGHRKSLDLQL
jgi:hypothetical protein